MGRGIERQFERFRVRLLSETGFDPMFGIGGSFNITEKIGVRVEYEKFLDVGDENVTGQSDVDLISASLVFRF